jgi:hypothetical protein
LRGAQPGCDIVYKTQCLRSLLAKALHLLSEFKKPSKRPVVLSNDPIQCFIEGQMLLLDENVDDIMS